MSIQADIENLKLNVHRKYVFEISYFQKKKFKNKVRENPENSIIKLSQRVKDFY